MTTITNDYLWAYSTVSKATLQNSSNGYLIISWAAVEDQLAPHDLWTEPQRKGTERPKRQKYVPNLNQAQQAEGFYIVTWCFARMTECMFYTIDQGQFSGGVENAPATIQTYDDNGQKFNAFQMTANRPVPGQDYDMLMGFYIDVKYRFTAGTKL